MNYLEYTKCLLLENTRGSALSLYLIAAVNIIIIISHSQNAKEDRPHYQVSVQQIAQDAAGQADMAHHQQVSPRGKRIFSTVPNPHSIYSGRPTFNANIIITTSSEKICSRLTRRTAPM